MLEILVAFVAGGLLVWALTASRAARAVAERDAARIERERSEKVAAQARAVADEAQRTRAAAESRAAQIEKSREDIANLFVAEAQKAFTNVSDTLVRMNRQQVDGSLDVLLRPLREMVENYRGELLKSEQIRSQSYGGLQEQMRALASLQESAQRETAKLAAALQSPTARGSWGEITLRRCVELAGMTEYCDFFMQETIEDEDGRRLRPDVLVRLPNNRVVAIDAKAPLGETIEDRAQRIRRHIDGLSRKEYQNAIGNSIDFVVLFVPGEQFLPNDGQLFEYATARKVVVASPMILVAILRAIEMGWKAEKTEENAKRMHDAGVELFNRFVKVMEHISRIGSSLHTTVEKYNDAIRSIDARLWPKGEEMQRMAGSGKEMANLEQLEAVPLVSSKLRLTMQSEEEGTVVPMDR